MLHRLPLLLLLALSPTAMAHAAPRVQATDAWCRANPPGAAAAACYVTLAAAADDRLVGAATPAAQRVEVHTMSMEGGVMRMRPLADLPLPRGQAVALRPGAEHLMLIAPRADLKLGETVVLTLRFATAPPLTIRAPVRAAAAPAALPSGARRP